MVGGCFLVILSRPWISLNFQSIVPQLFVTTGAAKALIATILFLALSSDCSTSLIFILYPFWILAFILWCSVPSLSSMSCYLYLASGSSSCMTLSLSSLVPLVNTLFLLLNVALAHLSNPHSFWILDTIFTVLTSPFSWLSFVSYSLRSST